MTLAETLTLTVSFLLSNAAQHALAARRLHDSDRQPPTPFAIKHKRFFIGFHCVLIVLPVTLLVAFLKCGDLSQTSEMWEARAIGLVVLFGILSEVRVATSFAPVHSDVSKIFCLYPTFWTGDLSMKIQLFVRIPVASTSGLVLTGLGIWKYQLPNLVLDGVLLAAVGDGLCLWSTWCKDDKLATKQAILVYCRLLCGLTVILLLQLTQRLQAVSSF